MRFFFVIALLVASCGTSEPTRHSSDSADAFDESMRHDGPTRYGAERGLDPDLETDLARFFREPLLITEPLPAPGLKVVLQRQLKRYGELNGRLQSTELPPEVAPVVAFRQAQLFARMACSIVNTPPPNQLAGEQHEMYSGLLREQAFPVLQQVAARLERIPQGDPLQPHAAELSAVPESPDNAREFDNYCANTRGYWQNSSNRLTVDETEAPSCEERDAIACYVWGELGSGGDAALARACDLGALVACPQDEPAR